MSNVGKKEYQAMANARAKKSPLGKDCLFAFLIGGAICAIGQILLDLYKRFGLSNDIALPLVSITLVAISAILTGFKVYGKIAKYGGAGTLVPITGFANSIVSPAMEYKPEGWILGVGVKMFSIAGPVLVYGGLTSVIAGLIYYFIKGASM
ncbi:MAG: stage V sporulation protein AC [Bacillota bacterium]|nr:stage V sporulation protein AC [Bacillota bacterium]